MLLDYVVPELVPPQSPMEPKTFSPAPHEVFPDLLTFEALIPTAKRASMVPPNSNAEASLSTTAEVELAAKNAILESRRKALESMKFRRAAAKEAPPVNGESMDVDVPVTASTTLSEGLPPTTAEKSIEQEVADLEREVMDLQSIRTDDVDVDDSLPTQILPPLLAATTISASLPILSATRGIKRPNAEDLENCPTTLPLRSLPPPSKRRVFGGVAQRPNRLVITLDDSDSESEPEVVDDAETQRLLAEKEENIRLLKEQIAARLKAKEVKRLRLAEGGRDSSVEGSPTPSEGMMVEMVQAVGEATATEIPRSATGTSGKWRVVNSPVCSLAGPSTVKSAGSPEDPIEIDSDSMAVDEVSRKSPFPAVPVTSAEPNQQPRVCADLRRLTLLI